MEWLDPSTEEITSASIPWVLAALAGPLFVQNVVRVAQRVIDLFWVGGLGSKPVAAIGIASPVLTLVLTATVSATFLGTQILTAQRVGADDTGGARTAAFTGLVVTVVTGLVIGVVVFLSAGQLVGLVTTTGPESGAVVRLTRIYLETLALGVVVAGISDVIEAAFVGWGDTRAALYTNATGVVTNLALDPVLIFGLGPVPALGLRGAALATVGGYLTSATLGAVFVVRGRAGGIYSRSAARIDTEEIRELLSVGLPRAVQSVASVTGTVVTVSVAYTVGGPAGVAAYTVATRVGSILRLPVSSLTQAAQSVIGQNLGAGDPDRAGRTTRVTAVFAVLILVCGGLVQWTIPGPIVRVVASAVEGQSFALSVTALQVYALGYPAVAVFSAIRAGFNGARRTKLTMVASAGQTWLLDVPIAATAGILLGFGMLGVFAARPLSTAVAAVVCLAYYRRTAGQMYEQAIEQVAPTGDD